MFSKNSLLSPALSLNKNNESKEDKVSLSDETKVALKNLWGEIQHDIFAIRINENCASFGIAFVGSDIVKLDQFVKKVASLCPYKNIRSNSTPIPISNFWDRAWGSVYSEDDTLSEWIGLLGKELEATKECFKEIVHDSLETTEIGMIKDVVNIIEDYASPLSRQTKIDKF